MQVPSEFNVIFIHIIGLDGEAGVIVTFNWLHALAEIKRDQSKRSEKDAGAKRV